MRFYVFLSVFILSIGNQLIGQEYFVAFKDKSTLDPTISKSVLSDRSIERRLSQGIPYDTTDMPINQVYLDSLAYYDLIPIFKSKWLNGVLIHSTDDTLVAFLDSLDFVAYIHDITKTTIGGGIEEVDIDTYGDSWDAISFLNADYFHEKGNYGENKLIALFDAGFSGVNTASPFSHLFDNNLIKDTYSFVSNDSTVFKSSSHGTNVLSLIAAYAPNDFMGISHQSEIALYQTENPASETILEEYNWVFAAERADSLGADLINSSLGYYSFDYEQTNHIFDELDGQTSVITKGAQIAAQKGILVVSSAGNSNLSGNWPYINFPSDAKDVLTVGSINYNESITWFSSRGPINNDYYKPELVAPGNDISVLNASGNSFSSSGTSFSAPLICGYAALVWNEHPELSSLEIKQLLINNASNFSTPNNTIGYGYPITYKIASVLPKNETKDIKKITYSNIKGQLFTEKPHRSGLYILRIEYFDGHTKLEKTIVY